MNFLLRKDCLPSYWRIYRIRSGKQCVCRIYHTCRPECYLSLIHISALAISYYSNLKGLKVELDSDRLFGIPLDVYIPLEQVAIQVNTDSEKIDILKEHLCKPVSYTHLRTDGIHHPQGKGRERSCQSEGGSHRRSGQSHCGRDRQH